MSNNNNKKFYQSKIVWLALATILIGANDQLAILGHQLPEEYQGLFTMALGALTLIARTYSGTVVHSNDSNVTDQTEK